MVNYTLKAYFNLPDIVQFNFYYLKETKRTLSVRNLLILDVIGKEVIKRT